MANGSRLTEEQGRARWAAYERDVLQASLDHRVPVGEPVERQSPLERGGVGTFFRVAEAVGSVVDEDDIGPEPFRDLPRRRYCWPPIQ